MNLNRPEKIKGGNSDEHIASISNDFVKCFVDFIREYFDKRKITEFDFHKYGLKIFFVEKFSAIIFEGTFESKYFKISFNSVIGGYDIYFLYDDGRFFYRCVNGSISKDNLKNVCGEEEKKEILSLINDVFNYVYKIFKSDIVDKATKCNEIIAEELTDVLKK